MRITDALLWVEWRALLQSDLIEDIEGALRGTYLAMGFPASEIMLRLNAVDLVHYGHSHDDVVRACRALRMAHVPEHKTRRAPLAGDIHNWLCPPEQVTDRADVSMQQIMGAMSRYGYMQGEAVARVIGETAWGVVKRLGGWTTLCASTAEGCTTTKAQLKKSLESAYRAEEMAVRHAELTQHVTEEHLKLAKRSSTQHARGFSHVGDVIPMMKVKT
ncbi:MAG: hypothetical protein EOO38_00175 [Cytophagaceae bacterium]|nr:MAG: hypothetical protein EOO38_00175 [Cytophagaceae bacterium]